MSYFNIIAQSSESTVVTEYKPQAKRSEAYQSEADLEKEFIRLLCELGYEYLTIHKEKDLIDNLRAQLEKLNDYQFSDDEWNRFFNEVLANSKDGIVEKTCLIQEDYVQVLRRDNGESKNITLIDKKNIHNNTLQVINQYAISADEGAAHDNRYDVTILVNGLPLIHIELKRRGVPIREAFNQIDRYQRDSFWAASGLYEFVQIFVISNGTNTKYYSNTTRFNHIKDANSHKAKKEKTSNSFEFTSFWADANNRIIPDLVDFTKTFFCKHTILNILTRYCVFTAENMLLVMRPYQIVATERILNRIEVANNYKKYGSVAGGGYIWHTTGSGKTLTSFKTARLASSLPYIDKVLFVVDRKDLDYQTMKEYDRFSFLQKAKRAERYNIGKQEGRFKPTFFSKIMDKILGEGSLEKLAEKNETREIENATAINTALSKDDVTEAHNFLNSLKVDQKQNIGKDFERTTLDDEQMKEIKNVYAEEAQKREEGESR